MQRMLPAHLGVTRRCGPCWRWLYAFPASGAFGSGSGDTGYEEASASSVDDGASSGSGAQSGSGSPGGSGSGLCVAAAAAAQLPAPVLQLTGEDNAVGSAGATGTSIRIRWTKPDCEPVQKFALRLRETGGPWVTIYEGHPGGGLSRTEPLAVDATW